MSWNGINLEGCATLGDTLRSNKYLRELNVSNNQISWDGALHISKGLKENDTLEVLYIGGNPLSMTGVLDLLDSIDNPQSAINTMDFTGVPVNRKIVYIVESLQKHRQIQVKHGIMIESDDVYGRRMVLRCDPLKLLIQFLADKSIKPYDLFKQYDPEKQYRVPREHFLKGLKAAKVPLDEYDYEKLLLRFDSSGKEGKINYQRLIRGVKDQIKQNKTEEKQRKLDAKRMTEPNNRNELGEDIDLDQSNNNDRDISTPDSLRSTPSPNEAHLMLNTSFNENQKDHPKNHKLKTLLLGKTKPSNYSPTASTMSTERSIISEVSLKSTNVSGLLANNRHARKVHIKAQVNTNDKMSTLYE